MSLTRALASLLALFATGLAIVAALFELQASSAAASILLSSSLGLLTLGLLVRYYLDARIDDLVALGDPSRLMNEHSINLWFLLIIAALPTSVVTMVIAAVGAALSCWTLAATMAALALGLAALVQFSLHQLTPRSFRAAARA